MSVLRVNSIGSTNGTSAIVFPRGLTIGDGRSITAGIVSITGVCTATTFVGDGSRLTNTPILQPSRVYALNIIL